MHTTTRSVLAALGGDREAFATLYQDHVGAVQTTVRGHLRDHHQVADAVQDTFANALESLWTLRNPERFRPWLLSIARHAAVDVGRANRRIQSVEEASRNEQTAADDPEELMLLAELATMVRGCVSGLSERDATAVRLLMLGFTPTDVAGAIGVSVGAAKVLLHRARRHLRSSLVLRVVTSGVDTGCASFAALQATDLQAAGRHLETCESCISAVRKELLGGGPPCNQIGLRSSRSRDETVSTTHMEERCPT